jgi:hypothetical protein
MQQPPLLERLDWFFASVSWMAQYPSSFVSTLSRDTSDHMPCLVSISTDIPKGKIIHFENYWMMHDEFMEKVALGWKFPTIESDKAKKMMLKFKNLRRVLRQWHTQLSNLNKSIESNKMMISFLDTLEEFRDLSLEEWNF